MKTKTILIVILATAAVSFVAWSRWKPDKQSDKAVEGLPLSVKIQAVAPSAISQSLAVSGTLSTLCPLRWAL